MAKEEGPVAALEVARKAEQALQDSPGNIADGILRSIPSQV